MRMNSATQCIVLLACIVICSTSVIPKCLCPKTIRQINPSLIADVIEHEPRPYCSKHEVIVTLKDKRQYCLNPSSDFTVKLLKAKHKADEKKIVMTKATKVQT